MTPNTSSPRTLWKALHLLEDWLATGFSREHAELEIDPEAAAAAVAASAALTGQAEEARGSAPGGLFVPVPTNDRAAALAAIATEVASCARCGLSVNRTKTVPGEGPLDPPVLFIGEGPGADEDASGRPFVGAAGQYLNTWLPPIGLERGQCFIANCVKCRPPQNREPHPEEIAACLPYLEAQIAAVRPKVICCLGRIAAQTLLGAGTSLGALRGRVHQWRGIPVAVTYHPSAVLRDKAGLRKPVWDDLKLLKSMLAG